MGGSEEMNVRAQEGSPLGKCYASTGEPFPSARDLHVAVRGILDRGFRDVQSGVQRYSAVKARVDVCGRRRTTMRAESLLVSPALVRNAAMVRSAVMAERVGREASLGHVERLPVCGVKIRHDSASPALMRTRFSRRRAPRSRRPGRERVVAPAAFHGGESRRSSGSPRPSRRRRSNDDGGIYQRQC
jgi:hypothetical protein